MQLAATVATAQQSDEQALPRPDRRHRFVGFPMNGVAASHTLIFFVSGPVNICRMMIGEEDPTLRRPTIRGLPLFESAVHQHGLDRTPSPHIGAGIKRIAQHVADEALRRNLPDEPRSADWVGG